MRKKWTKRTASGDSHERVVLVVLVTSSFGMEEEDEMSLLVVLDGEFFSLSRCCRRLGKERQDTVQEKERGNATGSSPPLGYEVRRTNTQKHNFG